MPLYFSYLGISEAACLPYCLPGRKHLGKILPKVQGTSRHQLAGDGKYRMDSGFHTGPTSLVFGRLVGSSAYAGVHLAALREDAAAGRLGCHALSLAGSAMGNSVLR